MKYLLPICIALFGYACNSKPKADPNRPLDISGTWVLMERPLDRQTISDPAQKLAQYEFGSAWEFLPDGLLRINIHEKHGKTKPETANYEWDKTQNKITVTGKFHYFFEILRHTHDSLTLHNIESKVTYEFQRKDFGKPTNAVAVNSGDNEVILSPLEGEWKLHYVQNELLRYNIVQDINRVSKGQIWEFDKEHRFKLTFEKKSAIGKWDINTAVQKMVVDIDGRKQAFRIASLAQEGMTLVDEDAGNKFVFTKVK